MSDCSVCGKMAQPSLSIRHRVCGHSTHTDCMTGTPNFKHCAACLAPQEDNSLRPAGANRVEREPHLADGIDYVNNPGQKKTTSLISASVGLVKSALGRGQDKKKPHKPTPEEVLRMRVPVGDIMSRHKYGMDHMLRDGVTIDDFIINGYTLDDLVKFEYMNGSKPRKALNCLTNGLGLTANHLRDYPDELPIEQFKKITQIAPEEFCTRLGMEFPEDSGLVCFGDNNWNAMDVVRFGLTMDDLMDDFGMYAVEQYMDLLDGVPARLRTKAEEGLKIDHEKHGSKLINLAQIAEEEERAEMERIAQEERLIQEEEEAIQQAMWEQEEAQRLEEEERERRYARSAKHIARSAGHKTPFPPRVEEEYVIVDDDDFSSSSEDFAPVEEEFPSSDEDEYVPSPPAPVRQIKSNHMRKEPEVRSARVPRGKFNMPRRQVRTEAQLEQASARQKMIQERKDRMNRIGFIG